MSDSRCILWYIYVYCDSLVRVTRLKWVTLHILSCHAYHTGGPMDFKPKWWNATVGCGMKKSPNLRNPTDPFRSTEIQRWAITRGTTHGRVGAVTNFRDWNWFCLAKSISDFENRHGPHTTAKSVPRIIAQRWISVMRYSERMCGIIVIFRFRNPTTHCGIPSFSFEVHRAPWRWVTLNTL